MEALLKVNDISMVFGGLRAVSNFSMEIKAGELIGLIGPNGAGKTTAFNMITGVYTPTEGEIMFNGTRTSGKKSYQVTQLGMARTFQNIRLFKDMSVLENVLVAQHMRMGTNLLEATLRLPSYMKREKHIHERARALLAEVDLSEHEQAKATSLPYGKQRRLEIARALATNPRLLLLDEPFSALDPALRQEMLQLVDDVCQRQQLTLLMVSHSVEDAARIATRAMVIADGRIAWDGDTQELLSGNASASALLGITA